MYRTVGELITKAKVEKCGDRELPILSMTMHDGIVFQGDRFKKQIASVDQSTYNVVYRNQLVVSFPIDEGVLAVQDITDAGIVSPAYKIWNVDEKKVVPKYLEAYLRSPHSIQYYKSKLRGTTARRRSITDSDLLEMDIPLPSIEKQRCIIENIRRVKSLQDAYNCKMNLLDKLIKARFVELFGDPVSNSKCFTKEELGKVCTKITDGTHDTPERYPEGYLLITGKNIRASGIIYDDVEYVSEEDHNIIYARCNPEYEDVLYTNIGVNYGTACLNDLQYEFSMKNVALLKPDRNRINGYYLWICLNLMRDHILLMNQVGGAQTFMGLATIKKIVIPIPPIELQNGFIDDIKQVDKSKVAVQKALDETKLLFDSLMQQYFG